MVRAPLHFHGRIPVPEVAPLTYRDGVTHLELVYELSQYLKNILHPSLQSTVDQVVADAEQLLSDATAQYVDGVQEFQRIHDAFMSDVNAQLIALNDTAMTDLLDDVTSLVGKTVREIIRDENPDRVYVGPARQYEKINDVFEDYPEGSVVIHLDDGEHTTEPLPTDENLKNVKITGNGRQAVTVTCNGPFVTSVINQDAWTIENFTLQHGSDTNTDHGIDVDYPRRWIVQNMEISGFGGDSIFYRGGLNSQIHGNRIFARDRSQNNGNSGVHIDRRIDSEPGSAATTHSLMNNYVQAGKLYGFLIRYTASGTTSMNDIAEYCEVGFRYHQSPITVISPYGEANERQIEIRSTSPAFFGRIQRSDMHIDWGEVSYDSRNIVHISNSRLHVGRGLFRGLSEDMAQPSDAVPSIRWRHDPPHGYASAPPGSLMITERTVQRYDTHLWLKSSGTDATGWEALGTVQCSTAELSNAGTGLNVHGKIHGKQVFNIRTNQVLYAHGPEPTDPWGDGNGEVVITPV